jgi:hypothetical protein
MNGAGLPYHLYGLASGNPYLHRALNPLTTPTDGDRLLGLDGFVSRENAQDYLRQRIDAEQPAFVLVGGRNHTGRTSMANWVLHSYFELRDVNQRYLPICVPVTDQSTFTWLLKAIARLWAKIKQTTDLKLTAETSKGFEDCLSVKSDLPYEELFQAALGAVSAELTDLGYAVGVAFEGIPNAGFVAAAKNVFESSQVAVVFTYDDYDHPQTTDARGFRSAQFDDVLDVYLKPLVSRQVGLLAKCRWADGSELAFPFEDRGLEELYQDTRTPIRKVLKRLEDFLDYQLEIAPPGAAPWPANQDLLMRSQWLAATFKRFDISP